MNLFRLGFLIAAFFALFSCQLPKHDTPVVDDSAVESVDLKHVKKSGVLRVSLLFDTVKYYSLPKIPNEMQIAMVNALANELGVKAEISIHTTTWYFNHLLASPDVDLIIHKIPVGDTRSLRMLAIFPFLQPKRRTVQATKINLNDWLKSHSIYSSDSSVWQSSKDWAWMVNSGNTELYDFMVQWKQNYMQSSGFRLLREKHIRKSAKSIRNKSYRKLKTVGKLADYKEIIKRAAAGTSVDWRLVASLAYQESKFNPDAVSPGGAMGMMQLVRSTANLYKVKNPFDAKQNLEGGVKLLQQLDSEFSDIEDDEQRMWFVVASYNCGAGHIQDARKLAKKYGRDPDYWEESVAYFLEKKAEREFYTDKVVRWGFCRGAHTVRFANQVMERFYQYKATYPD